MPSTDKDRAPPALPQSEGEQATRDILASAGIKLLPEFSEAQDPPEGEHTPPSPLSPSTLASAAKHEAARLLASFTARVSLGAARAKNRVLAPILAALPALLSRFSRKKKPEKPPAPVASEAPPSKKPRLGSQED